jgi:hypothetical protein
MFRGIIESQEFYKFDGKMMENNFIERIFNAD